jgi:hypothetical protein
VNVSERRGIENICFSIIARDACTRRSESGHAITDLEIQSLGNGGAAVLDLETRRAAYEDGFRNHHAWPTDAIKFYCGG